MCRDVLGWKLPREEPGLICLSPKSGTQEVLSKYLLERRTWQRQMCCADLPSRKDLLPICNVCRDLTASFSPRDPRAGTRVRRVRHLGHNM